MGENWGTFINNDRASGQPPISSDADSTARDSIIALEALLNFKRSAVSMVTENGSLPRTQNLESIDEGNLASKAETTQSRSSESPVLSYAEKVTSVSVVQPNMPQTTPSAGTAANKVPKIFGTTLCKAAPSLLKNSKASPHLFEPAAVFVQPPSQSILSHSSTSSHSSNSITPPPLSTSAEGNNATSKTTKALSSSCVGSKTTPARSSVSTTVPSAENKGIRSLVFAPNGGNPQSKEYSCSSTTPSIMATKILSSSPAEVLSLEPETKPSPSIPIVTTLHRPENILRAPSANEQSAFADESAAAAAAAERIRREEVEAALRSKPQRGRKRENLSALERLELTRTRNREHAKSTRIRKKARHEELVNREQQFFVLKRRDDLDNARRDSVLNFMMLRSAILRLDLNAAAVDSSRTRPCFVGGKRSLSVASEESSPSSDSSDVTVRASGSSAAAQSAEKDVGDCLPSQVVTSSNTSNVPKVHTNELESKLAEFIEDVKQLKVTPFLTDGRLPSNHGIQGVRALRALDKKLVNIVMERFSFDTVPALRFRVLNSSSGIAMTTGNDAYAEYDAIVEDTPSVDQPEAVVLKGIMKVQFTPNSHKIQSVGVSSMSVSDSSHESEFHPCPVTRKSHGGAFTRVQFPSVVSLDNSASVGSFSGQSEDDEKNEENHDSELGSGETKQEQQYHEDDQHDNSTPGMYI